MGRRKNYPWDSRVDKQMTNLVSDLLAGLIVAPFAIMDSVPNNTSSLNTEPVSKPVAIIYLIIGIAVTPLFITLISLAIELFDLFLIGPLLCFALIFIPLVAWGGIIYTVIESFSNNKKTNNKPKGVINDYQKLVLSFTSVRLKSHHNDSCIGRLSERLLLSSLVTLNMEWISLCLNRSGPIAFEIA